MRIQYSALILITCRMCVLSDKPKMKLMLRISTIWGRKQVACFLYFPLRSNRIEVKFCTKSDWSQQSLLVHKTLFINKSVLQVVLRDSSRTYVDFSSPKFRCGRSISVFHIAIRLSNAIPALWFISYAKFDTYVRGFHLVLSVAEECNLLCSSVFMVSIPRNHMQHSRVRKEVERKPFVVRIIWRVLDPMHVATKRKRISFRFLWPVSSLPKSRKKRKVTSAKLELWIPGQETLALPLPITHTHPESRIK